MPTIFTHAVVGMAAATACSPKRPPLKLIGFSVFLAVLPDADVIGFALNVPYGSFWGHRGFFHSPFFAMVCAFLVTALFFRKDKVFGKSGWPLFLFFSLVGASHGLLDALTTGGLGVALLWPLDSARYFFPVAPILVSPIGVKAFFSPWGLTVLKSEIIWVWGPSILLVIITKTVCVIIKKKENSHVVIKS